MSKFFLQRKKYAKRRYSLSGLGREGNGFLIKPVAIAKLELSGYSQIDNSTVFEKGYFSPLS